VLRTASSSSTIKTRIFPLEVAIKISALNHA
jgi:hypothetical protein